MRSSGSFHPEWGYLAPAPNVMRTARVVAVATAIGATAGAAVVLSLVVGPAASPAADPGKTVVVVHSLVQPAQAAGPSPTGSATAAPAVVTTPTAEPPAAPVTLPQQPISVQASAQSSDMTAPTPPPTTAQPLAPPASESTATATAETPASTSTLAEVPPATETSAPTSDQPVIMSDDADSQKRLTKKRRTAEYDSTRGGPAGSTKKKASNRGLGPFLRHFFFSARAGNSYFPN
jgi:hypothetical protein